MLGLTPRQFTITITLSLLVVSGVIGAGVYYKNKPIRETVSGPPAPAASYTKPITSPQMDGSVRLLATGDMIAHDSINDNAKQPDGNYDYLSLMKDMQPYFAKGDVNFCNQSTPAGGEAFGISGYPVFNAPVAFTVGLKNVGCNVINIGTNHTNDKGQPLVDATVAAWDKSGVLAVAGANRTAEEQAKPRVFEAKGIKFGFVSYTDYTNVALPNTYGVNKYDTALAKSQIDAIAEQTDFIIASMRWGTEYSPDVNARQDQIAQELADLGVDVIFGHGPHAMQPVKKLTSSDGREVYSWFSLGNFLNSQLDPETLIGGFASMEIDIATKKVISVGFMPVYQHYEWTAAEKAAGSLLARKNFKMLPLDQSAELLAASQLGTTVEAQTDRITKLLNSFTPVPIIASTDF